MFMLLTTIGVFERQSRAYFHDALLNYKAYFLYRLRVSSVCVVVYVGSESSVAMQNS